MNQFLSDITLMHYILINVHIINALFPRYICMHMQCIYRVAYHIARQTIIYLTYLCLFCLTTCFSLQTYPTSHHLIVFNPSSSNTHSHQFYHNNGWLSTELLSWEKFDIIGALLNMKIKSGRLNTVWFGSFDTSVLKIVFFFLFYSKCCNLF